MATPARLAGVGVFVLAGLLLFSVGLFLIGDRQMAFAKKFTVYTEFKKITGLQPGAIVRVSGAKAGSITEILPPNTPSEKFRVKLELTEDLHQLVRTDSVATIETEGLVGGSYLGIATGTDAAPPVARNATIARQGAIRHRRSHAADGRHDQKVNDTFDEMKGEVQAHGSGHRRHRRQCQHAARRRQRRSEADGGIGRDARRATPRRSPRPSAAARGRSASS